MPTFVVDARAGYRLLANRSAPLRCARSTVGARSAFRRPVPRSSPMVARRASGANRRASSARREAQQLLSLDPGGPVLLGACGSGLQWPVHCRLAPAPLQPKHPTWATYLQPFAQRAVCWRSRTAAGWRSITKKWSRFFVSRMSMADRPARVAPGSSRAVGPGLPRCARSP